MPLRSPQGAFTCAWENESIQIKERAKTKRWRSKLAAWLPLLSPQEKKETLAVIFLMQFFYPAHLFQMCYSDVDAEYVCSYYSLEGNLLCGVIDFYHFVSGVNTCPRFAVEYVPQARCNPWYTELKSDFTTYYCTLYSHLNCGWVMKSLSLIKTGIRLQFLHSVICCFALIST